MRRRLFRTLALRPKLFNRVRGAVFRMLVKVAGGQCGPGMRIEHGFRLRQGFHSGLNFGRDVYFGSNTTIDCLVGAELSIGSNTTFTQGVFIGVVDALYVGDDCLIGEYCSLRDANHVIADPSVPIVDQAMDARPVTIEPNVWLGRGVAVLAGVTIGEGAVIGANAVVTRDIPAKAIAVGSPAQMIKSRKAS